MKTSELFGKEVLDSNANRVGKVADIDFDLSQGVIHYLIIKAGFTKKFTIPLSSIDKIGDKIILKVKEEELK